MHEAIDSEVCATTACLNGFALLDNNYQGKSILSLTMRHLAAIAALLIVGSSHSPQGPSRDLLAASKLHYFF